MTDLLHLHFNSFKNAISFTEDESEEWNIDENLLLEGTTTQNIQYCNGSFDHESKNSLQVKINQRKIANKISIQHYSQENTKTCNNLQALKHTSDRRHPKNKPTSLKEEISMLLRILALKNEKSSSSQIYIDLNEDSNLQKEESKIQLITMEDVEPGI